MYIHTLLRHQFLWKLHDGRRCLDRIWIMACALWRIVRVVPFLRLKHSRLGQAAHGVQVSMPERACCCQVPRIRLIEAWGGCARWCWSVEPVGSKSGASNSSINITARISVMMRGLRLDGLEKGRIEINGRKNEAREEVIGLKRERAPIANYKSRRAWPAHCVGRSSLCFTACCSVFSSRAVVHASGLLCLSPTPS